MLCGKKLNPIKLKWKEDVVIDAGEPKDEDGESRGKLPRGSQRNGEPHEQEHGILKKNGEN